MDIEPRADGNLHIRVGIVEKWIVSTLGVLVIGVVAWAWNTGNEQLAQLGANVSKLSTGQAVTNSRLDMLSSQLADVPGLTRQLAELQVQVSRNSADIHELQSDTRRVRR